MPKDFLFLNHVRDKIFSLTHDIRKIIAQKGAMNTMIKI